MGHFRTYLQNIKIFQNYYSHSYQISAVIYFYCTLLKKSEILNYEIFFNLPLLSLAASNVFSLTYELLDKPSGPREFIYTL